MDTQQIRFSSNNEINTTGGVFAEPLTINKRRACSNGFPNQFLLDTSTTTSAWAPVSSSSGKSILNCSFQRLLLRRFSGFGGSNTMAAMTASFNSVNTSPLLDQQQKPLSRSLESLAIIGAPSTSSDYMMMMMNGPEMGVDGAMHKDDSRINYSYGCDSGAVSSLRSFKTNFTNAVNLKF